MTEDDIHWGDYFYSRRVLGFDPGEWAGRESQLCRILASVMREAPDFSKTMSGRDTPKVLQAWVEPDGPLGVLAEREVDLHFRKQLVLAHVPLFEHFFSDSKDLGFMWWESLAGCGWSRAKVRECGDLMDSMLDVFRSLGQSGKPCLMKSSLHGIHEMNLCLGEAQSQARSVVNAIIECDPRLKDYGLSVLAGDAQ